MIVTILLFLIIFGVIVMVHELGHFLLAKAGGIKVNEFCLGMGPKLFRFTKGDTEYSLRLFPIGGACMFEGEDGLESENGVVSEGSFQNAGVWVRMSTVFAGPFFNFILAFLFGIILAGYSGTDRPVIQDVTEGFAAEEAGIQSGDLLTRINGERIYLARELNLYTMMNEGEPITVEYERDGERTTVTLQPKYDADSGKYLLGFYGYTEVVQGLNVFRSGYYELRYCIKASIKSLEMLIQGKAGKDDIAGPVGMAQVVNEVKEATAPYGPVVVFMNMMNLAMLLSVSLGVMNLLPLPALDGGRLVFLLIEVIRGKPIPPEKEGIVHFAGFVVLMVVMVLVMFNDVQRILR